MSVFNLLQNTICYSNVLANKHRYFLKSELSNGCAILKTKLWRCVDCEVGQKKLSYINWFYKVYINLPVKRDSSQSGQIKSESIFSEKGQALYYLEILIAQF